jgi:hypothetical protein
MRQATIKGERHLTMLKRTLVAAFVLMIPTARASAVEGCIAVNPGQAACRYTATATTDASATGVGSWIVTVKHGRRTITYSPNGYYGEPTVETVSIHKGDKVTAKALDAGSSVIVGSP